MSADPLDNVAWSALTGRQRHLGTATARCAAFRPEISPFAAFAAPPTAADWDELAVLVGPGREIVVTPEAVSPPPTWTVEHAGQGFQLVGERLATIERRPAAPHAEVVELGDGDVDEMLALVDVARPGPFERRTIVFGDYLGIRRSGQLVAMMGTRMRIPVGTELSALATHPEHRGQGFAERLMREVAHRIASRGELPFLHVAAENTAIRLYEALGFTVRRETSFTFARSPR